MDRPDKIWEQGTPLPDPEAELKKMRRALRRRNRKVILTSVVLVIAILFSAVKIGIPALEKQYWDPRQCTYLEEVTDLTLTMNIYNELFGHGKHFMDVEIQKQGFASYSLEAAFVEYQTMRRLADISFRTASITKGVLNTATNFWLDIIPGVFPKQSTRANKTYMQQSEKTVRATLQSLPEYVQLCAAVSFPEDLTMEQLQQLQYRHANRARFLWAILRCCDPASTEYITKCGVHLTEYMSERYDPAYWSDTPYPNLFVERYNWSYQDMEEHITSMLRFCDDQLQQGTGILPEGEDSHYYQQVLDYFEENGIKTYGCYLIASPQVFLELLDTETVCYISLTDAWIGF